MARRLLLLAGLGLALREARADTDTATVNGVQVRAPPKVASKERELSEADGKPAPERRDAVFPVFHPTQSPGYGGFHGGQTTPYDDNIFHPSTKPPISKIVGPVIGGVVGAGAIAGVIAISVLQAKKNGALPKAAAPQPANQVTGGMTLQVPNGGTFMSDSKAQAAVAQGIADAAGVDPKYVHVTNLQSANAARMLTDGVKVAYTIDVPKTALASADSVTAKIKAKPLTSLTKHVQKALNTVKGPGFNVAVTQDDAAPVAPPPAAASQAAPALPAIAAKSVASGAPPAATPAPGFLAGASPPPTSPPTLAPTPAPVPSTTIASISSGSTEGQVIALAGALVLCGCLAICLAAVASFMFGKKKPKRRPTQEVAPEEYYPDQQQPLMEQQKGTLVQMPDTTPDMFSQYAAQPPTDLNIAGANMFAGSIPTLQDVVPMTTMPPPPAYGMPPSTNLFPSASPLATTLPATGYLGGQPATGYLGGQPATGYLGQSLPTTGLGMQTYGQLPPTIYG